MNGGPVSETLQTSIERRLNEYRLGADGPSSLRDLARETPTPLLLTHPLGSQRFRAVVTDGPIRPRCRTAERSDRQPGSSPLGVHRSFSRCRPGPSCSKPPSGHSRPPQRCPWVKPSPR